MRHKGRRLRLSVVLVSIVMFGASTGSVAAPTSAQVNGPGAAVNTGMADSGPEYAIQNRPTTANIAKRLSRTGVTLNDGQLEAVSDIAAQTMEATLCPCGCPRQSILECDCRTASELRARVMDLMTQTDSAGTLLHPLATAAGRKDAHEHVLRLFADEFGDRVLAKPRASSSWIVPAVALLSLMCLFVVLSRRWLRRGPSASGALGSEDDSGDDSRRRET